MGAQENSFRFVYLVRTCYVTILVSLQLVTCGGGKLFIKHKKITVLIKYIASRIVINQTMYLMHKYQSNLLI